MSQLKVEVTGGRTRKWRDLCKFKIPGNVTAKENGPQYKESVDELKEGVVEFQKQVTVESYSRYSRKDW